MTYDSTEDTLRHIFRVRDLLDEIIGDLDDRWSVHDASKLDSPEKEVFDRVTPLLDASEYGSDEYFAQLADMKVALDHHYATYRHHPEHFENGIRGMNLIDMMEMLADWKAATERTESGNLENSIFKNAERFGYGKEIGLLLINTARDMGWLDG
jgi:hypothetical protein